MVTISPNVLIGPYKRATHPNKDRFGEERCTIQIIGSKNFQNALIFGNVQISEHSAIGATPVVNKSLFPLTMVAGNTAKPIEKQFRNEDLRSMPD